MAYGPLAGLDAAHGLYTSLFTSLFYFPFGSSRHNSYGVVAVTSMMAASVRYKHAPYELSYYTSPGLRTNGSVANETGFPVEPHENTPYEIIAAVTFSCGIISILMAFLRIGFLSVLISDQISSGFTTAVAVHVITSQLDKVLALKVGRYTGAGKLLYVYRDIVLNITHVHLPSLAMSAVGFVFLVFMKEWLSKRVMRGPVRNVPLPADMILIVVATIVSHFMALNTYGFRVVGHIPSSIPVPSLPKFSIVVDVFLESISVAIAIYCISISLAQIFARRFNYKVDSEQELFAVGVTHLLTSFFSCMPPCAAMARTSVLIGSGGNSQICGLVASVVVILVIFFVGPLLQSLPQCILAIIIIVALKNMLKQFSQLVTLWKISKPDFVIWLGTFLTAVLLDITDGLSIGVALAFFIFGFRLIGNKLSVVGVFKNTELYFEKKVYPEVDEVKGVAVVAWKAPLFYGNASFFVEQACAYMNEKWNDHTPQSKAKVTLTKIELKENRTSILVSQEGRVLICDFSCVSLVDTPGLSALNQVIKVATNYQAEVYLCHCLDSVKKTIMSAYEHYEKLKTVEFFPSIHDAFLFANICRDIHDNQF